MRSSSPSSGMNGQIASRFRPIPTTVSSPCLTSSTVPLTAKCWSSSGGICRASSSMFDSAYVRSSSRRRTARGSSRSIRSTRARRARECYGNAPPDGAVRALGVVVDAHVQPGGEIDVVQRAPGPGRAVCDTAERVLEAGARRERADEHAVGDLAADGQHVRAARGDVDRDLARAREIELRLVDEHMVAVEAHDLATPQAAHHLHGLADRRRRPPALDAERCEPADPRADAQHRASAGELVDGGNRRGGERRVADVRIGDAAPDPYRGRRESGCREPAVDVPEEPLVSNPQVAEAERLDLPDERDHLRRRSIADDADAGLAHAHRGCGSGRHRSYRSTCAR